MRNDLVLEQVADSAGVPIGPARPEPALRLNQNRSCRTLAGPEGPADHGMD